MSMWSASANPLYAPETQLLISVVHTVFSCKKHIEILDIFIGKKLDLILHAKI